MHAHERHKLILDRIAADGAVTVSDLCSALNVSDMTVRRDLKALEEANLVRRIHGGAVAAEGRSYEPPFMVRSQEAQAAKHAIAKEAANLIHDGDSIALDVGTTTLALAESLRDKQGLTVITASLPIANVLVDLPNIRVILTGGILRSEEHSMVGDIAEETLSRFHVDKAFVGIGGIDLEVGLTEYNIDDTRTKRSLIQCGQQRILLADSSKFGRRVFASVSPLTEITTVVTDNNLSNSYHKALIDAGITVHITQVEERFENSPPQS